MADCRTEGQASTRGRPPQGTKLFSVSAQISNRPRSVVGWCPLPPRGRKGCSATCRTAGTRWDSGLSSKHRAEGWPRPVGRPTRGRLRGRSPPSARAKRRPSSRLSGEHGQAPPAPVPQVEGLTGPQHGLQAPLEIWAGRSSFQ